MYIGDGMAFLYWGWCYLYSLQLYITGLESKQYNIALTNSDPQYSVILLFFTQFCNTMAKKSGKAIITSQEIDNNNIHIQGAREHNLQDISIKIPKNNLTVLTGISGSGKSSLAFDTIYAEGQRRYLESFSAYARQFMGTMDRRKQKNFRDIFVTPLRDRKSTRLNSSHVA